MAAVQTLESVLLRPEPVSEYRPTHAFAGPYINNNHRGFGLAPVEGVKIVHQVRGSLRRADAAKIYELAYFSAGDTLDLGTNWGLSAFVASTALTDAGAPHRVKSIDLEPKMTARAGQRLAELGISNVDVINAEATEWVSGYQDRFGFAFVDHSHAYEHVLGVCQVLAPVLLPGAMVAFHDFADRRNLDPSSPDFRVMQAVRDGLDSRFTFAGVCGCMGLFRFAG